MIITNDNITEATIAQEEVINPFGANYLAWNNPNYDESTANEWVAAMKNNNLPQTFTLTSMSLSNGVSGPSVRSNGNIIGLDWAGFGSIIEINPFLEKIVATYSNPFFVAGSAQSVTFCTFDDKIIVIPYSNGNAEQILSIVDPVTNTGFTYSFNVTGGYGYKSAVQRSPTSILFQSQQFANCIDFNPISLTHSVINSTGNPSGVCLAPNGKVYLGPNRAGMIKSVNYISTGNSYVSTGDDLDNTNYKFGTPIYSIKTDRIYCPRGSWGTASFLVINPNTDTSEFITPTGETMPSGGDGQLVWACKSDINGNVIFSVINDGSVYKYDPATNILSKVTGGPNNNYSNSVLAGDGRIWYWGNNSTTAVILNTKLSYPLDTWTFMSRMLSCNQGSMD